MARFIVVHEYDCEEVLVNIDLVYQVIRNTDGKAEIHWAFEQKEAVEGEWIKTSESYEEVREMILGGADNGERKTAD